MWINFFNEEIHARVVSNFLHFNDKKIKALLFRHSDATGVCPTLPPLKF